MSNETQALLPRIPRNLPCILPIRRGQFGSAADSQNGQCSLSFSLLLHPVGDSEAGSHAFRFPFSPCLHPTFISRFLSPHRPLWHVFESVLLPHKLFPKFQGRLGTFSRLPKTAETDAIVPAQDGVYLSSSLITHRRGMRQPSIDPDLGHAAARLNQAAAVPRRTEHRVHTKPHAAIPSSEVPALLAPSSAKSAQPTIPIN